MILPFTSALALADFAAALAAARPPLAARRAASSRGSFGAATARSIKSSPRRTARAGPSLRLNATMRIVSPPLKWAFPGRDLVRAGGRYQAFPSPILGSELAIVAQASTGLKPPEEAQGKRLVGHPQQHQSAPRGFPRQRGRQPRAGGDAQGQGGRDQEGRAGQGARAAPGAQQAAAARPRSHAGG